MKLDRHEADDAHTYLSYLHSPLFRSADAFHRPPLIFSPVWMLSPENLGTQHPLERRKGRRPRPQREADYRLGVSIVEWSNPWGRMDYTPPDTNEDRTRPYDTRITILRAEGSTRRRLHRGGRPLRGPGLTYGTPVVPPWPCEPVWGLEQGWSRGGTFPAHGRSPGSSEDRPPSNQVLASLCSTTRCRV